MVLVIVVHLLIPWMFLDGLYLLSFSLSLEILQLLKISGAMYSRVRKGEENPK